MNGQDFLRIANEAFVPFLKELGFVMDAPSISGRFYRVSFAGPAHTISVSYEPGDNALFVMVFSVKDGKLSDVDDRIETPRLSDLNNRFMHDITNDQRKKNDDLFISVVAQSKEERLLLKAAKELRLVLPKYVRS